MKIFLRRIARWSALILLFSLPLAARTFTFAPSTYAPDEAWTGVLRFWTCAATPFGIGSPLSWLNTRAAAFEKLHPGVRLQFTEISQELLASLSTASCPPDAIVFTPGMLQTAENLIPLSQPQNLLPGLSKSGIADSVTKAIPVAMGGYFWACADSTLISQPGSPDCPPTYTFIAPPDTAHRSYSAAMLALFSGEIPANPQSTHPGVNLGLPAASATESPQGNCIPLEKPADFAENTRADSARSLFAADATDAFIVTAQDIRRLEQLSESGAAPEYHISPGGAAFTDQLAMAAVIDHSGADSAQRERLCADFISFLLEDESQSTLKSAYAFRVTEGESLYSSHRGGMAEAEASFQGDIIVPNAFDNAWRERAAQSAALFIETDRTAADLLRAVFPQ